MRRASTQKKTNVWVQRGAMSCRRIWPVRAGGHVSGRCWTNSKPTRRNIRMRRNSHAVLRSKRRQDDGWRVVNRSPTRNTAVHGSGRISPIQTVGSYGCRVASCRRYNAQAVATVEQLIVAAEVTNDGSDDAQFVPMVAATKEESARRRCGSRVRTVVADAGYWSKDNVATPGVEAIIAPGRTLNIRREVRAQAKRAEVLARVERGDLIDH